MERIILLIFFLSNVLLSSFSQSANPTVFLEKNIVVPSFNKGYKSLCDSLYTLVKFYKPQPDTFYTYVVEFSLTVNKKGNCFIDVNPDYSNCFTKLSDSLFQWITRFNKWDAASTVSSKRKIKKYTLYFSIVLNTSVWITIVDRRKLYELYRAEYPIDW